MSNASLAVGVVLMLVGVGSYAVSGAASITALAPVLLGAVLMILGYQLRREPGNRLAVFAIVFVSLAGVLASLRVVEDGKAGGPDLLATLTGAGAGSAVAIAGQASTAVASLVLLILAAGWFLRQRNPS